LSIAVILRWSLHLTNHSASWVNSQYRNAVVSGHHSLLGPFIVTQTRRYRVSVLTVRHDMHDTKGKV